MNVSAVIPTYYREYDLSKLFDSLLRQSVKPFEVIIVDDTPTPEIRLMCEKYEEKFQNLKIQFIYVRNPKERSAAIARNVGAKKVKGDIVLFLDSDVILYPDYVEKILDVFQQYPKTLGVQGWIVGAKYPDPHPLIDFIQAIFRTESRLVKDQCKFSQYPIVLTRIIHCEYLSGSNMSFKRDVFREFQFDENLKKYSYMEDKLFGFSVHKRYPNSLYITPHAKCIHKGSKEGRMDSKELTKHRDMCRKYVLKKLFGFKGLLIYYWQNVGYLMTRSVDKFWNFMKKK